MTNVSTPEKKELRRRLSTAGVAALEAQGWKIERIQASGKASVRRITKGKDIRTISIRTTQDTWIAFQRKDDGSGWVTLDDVDAVVAVSVDDPDNPKFVLVHLIDGDDLRDRFDRAYAARKEAGHTLPKGRGVWVSLYIKDSTRQPNHVGAGAGLDYPPIARVPLDPSDKPDGSPSTTPPSKPADTGALTISEAKHRLALTFGVDPDKIKITIEG